MPKYTSQGNQEVKEYVLLEKGEHTLEIVDAVEKMSSNGNEMIKLTLEKNGSKVYDNLVFTPKAFFKIDQLREAMGEAVNKGEEKDITPADFLGKSVKAMIDHEENDGKTYPKIKYYIKKGADTPF